VASSIKPVTIESLKATTPDPFDVDASRRKKKTAAAASVSKYRIFTAFALVLLMLAQIYWINGSDLAMKIETLFTRIEDASFNIEKRKREKNYGRTENDPEIDKLNNKKKELAQEFGATYQLLQEWNRLWQIFVFRKQFEAKITHYVKQKYEEDMETIQRRVSEVQDTIKSRGSEPGVVDASRKTLKKLTFESKKRKFEHEFDKERNKLFLTRISAEFIIRGLQIYGLPLLYGLLGAIIYTLRNLASEIKNLTYTHHSETKYRLRIIMGLLGGMAIGWFLKPEELGVSGSMSPMALAFLAGYNVEVLFAVMDKFIETISKFTLAVRNRKDDPEE